MTSLLLAALATQSSNDHVIARKLDETLSALAHEDRFAGCVVVLRGNRTLFAKAYGMADRALGVSNSLRTKFRFHSISKWFTGAYVAQLMEEGRLSPSDPVAKYVPGWPSNLQSVQIGHLLTHTSGLPWSTNDWADRYRISPSSTLKELIADVPVASLVSAPQPWTYNNVNFEVAAAVAEAATGTAFVTDLPRRVFERARLTDTELATPVGEKVYAGDRLVRGLATGYNGEPGKPVNTVCYSSAIPASGGVVGTVPDLAKFGRAFYSGRLLSPVAFARMTEGVTTTSKNRYGYGVVIGVKDGRRFFRHDGGNNGGVAWLEVFPDDDVVVAAASNLGYADMAAVSHLSQTIFAPTPQHP